MATWGALEVDIYDRSHTLLGTITTAFDCEGSEGIGEKGGGWFRFPASDSAAKTLVQKYRIAVGHSYNDVRAADTIIFCLEILDVQLEKGQPNIIKASGPGRLNELTYDNLAYTLISDGSGGPSTTWQDDVLSTAAQTWTLFTMGTGASQAYLQAAGESVYDAFVQLSRQNNHAISYNLRQAPARNIWRIVNNVVGSPNPTDPFFNQLELSQPADPSTVESDHKAAVIRGKPEIIEETTEVVTRLYVYGAGMGAGRFTIADADGLVSLPAGFTADYTNSVIINSALEAVTGQPRVVRVEQFSHIKPETDDDTDPNYTAARQTAAIQLVNAGLSYLQERTGDKRIFYEVTAMAHGDYMPGQLVNLDYSDDDYTISADYVLHKFTHRFDRRTERVSVFLLGEPVYRQKPEFVQVISEKLRRIDETIRHATAFAQSPGVPGSGDAIDQAAFHLAADHPGLPNRRIAADGLGTVYSDGGAGGDVSWGLRTPLSIGMGTSNDPGDATTGHTHANDGTLAPAGAGYVVVALSDDLPNERLAVGGDGISITDQGFGGGNLTWAARLDANGGLEFNSAQIRVKLPTNHGLSRSSAGLALGTPSTITGSSTNAVTTTSHTHALSIGATDLPVHVIATNAGLGAQHSISGGTAGHVFRVTGSTTAALAQLQHGDLGGVTANQHHNQSHVLATTSGLGPDHTASGLTSGQYLRATGSTTAAFQVIQDGDLPTGSTLSVSSPNSGTSHAITTSNAVSSATAVILATDSNGRLQVRGFGAGTSAASNNWYLMASGGGIGLDASSKARLTFTDTTNDTVVLSNGLMGINATPTGMLHIATDGSRPAIVLDAGTEGAIGIPTGNRLRIGHWSGSAFTTRMTIDETGQMALGTPLPTSIISIFTNTNGAERVKILNSSTGSSAQALYEAGADGSGLLQMGIVSNAGSIMSVSNAAYVQANGTSLIARTVGSGEKIIFAGGVAGTTNIATMESGLIVGSPTGGDKGAGTINAQAVYDDNTLLTDYVFEPDYQILPIAEMEAYYQDNLHLPTIPGRDEWQRRGAFSLGELATRLWETVEVQAIYIAQLNRRLEVLENG